MCSLEIDIEWNKNSDLRFDSDYESTIEMVDYLNNDPV